jgi:PAS domain S-box-containing protein
MVPANRTTPAANAEIGATERLRRKFVRSQRELAAFIDTASMGLNCAGPDGIIKWANTAELQMLGYKPEEYIGRSMADFHVDGQKFAEVFARLLCGEKIQEWETSLICKNGAHKHVLIDLNGLWEDGRFVHSFCFTRDVTPHRRSESISRHMAAIVESSQDAIVSKDLNGIITSWNQGAQRLFGYLPEEVVGKSILILIPEDRRAEEPRILAAIRRGEPISHYETIRRRKDGTLIDISLTVSPIRDAQGKVVGVSKIARDISQQKKAEAELRAAREQLARANEDLERKVEARTASLKEATAQMEEFSYTVSHDLRAPLRAMAIYSSALMDDYAQQLPPEAVHYLKRISENSVLLDRMILDVLAYSRVSRTELRMERIHLDDVVAQIIAPLREMAPRPEITVEPLLDVMGHKPALIQALTNLLANAVKFVPPNATPEIRIWSERRGEDIRIWVEDHGIGVPPHLQKKLFGMFERIHPELNYEGTGVGLAIVRKAAHRMGGTAGMESAPVQGSRFWIQLPAAG